MKEYAWLIWVVVGVLLIAAEMASGELVLAMIGVAALGGAAAEALFGSSYVDAAVFAAVALGLLSWVRPRIKRRMLDVPEHRTNVDALIGAKATVVSTVDAHVGQVKIGGELWSAKAYVESQVLQPGETVTVMSISGATAVVWADQ
ncbi:NfeD family protein [Pseudonocardiaceae bacterium YIM PH 21723]|nr:NfeD family protein [Pseudonocardiaceae bacterium YIM PH 21723]